MSIIAKAAYLKICKRCGSHGSVVFSNNEESEPFGNKVEAYSEVSVALATGFVSDAEASHLREEINNWVPPHRMGRKPEEGYVVHEVDDSNVAQPRVLH